MDKIILQGLHVEGILGVHEWEREQRREIIVSVTLFTDTHAIGRTDDLADGLDYSLVAREIRALVEQAERRTVEALAEDVAALCLEHPGVKKALVRVEKPGAIPQADPVAVEVERP